MQKIRFNPYGDDEASVVTFTRTVLNFPQLEKITNVISSTVGFDYESFGKLLKSCQNLDNFKLFSYHLAGFVSGRMVDLTKVVSECCPRLKKLSLLLDVI